MHSMALELLAKFVFLFDVTVHTSLYLRLDWSH
jgi:hypothetical protein